MSQPNPLPPAPKTEKKNDAADEFALTPPPTHGAQRRRFSDFATVGEALDYAAQGGRGLNFHDPRGRLMRAYSYRELRDDARLAAYRLIAAGVQPGDPIALIAEIGAEFAALLFGDRKSTRPTSSHQCAARMPSSA